MAENTTTIRSEVDWQAGRKAHPTELNRVRTAVIDSAATYAAVPSGDTIATHLVIPAGSRVLLPVSFSCAVGTASSTLSVGIRNASTKAAIDATAVVNAVSAATAVTGQYNTGTKLISGQYYTMPTDVELYLTTGGATLLANQPFRFEVQWVSP